MSFFFFHNFVFFTWLVKEAEWPQKRTSTRATSLSLFLLHIRCDHRSSHCISITWKPVVVVADVVREPFGKTGYVVWPKGKYLQGRDISRDERCWYSAEHTSFLLLIRNVIIRTIYSEFINSILNLYVGILLTPK